jgi:hypothetical protein
MAKKRMLTDEQVEAACRLREDDGLSTAQIVRQLKLPIGEKSLEWVLIVNGAESPNAVVQADFYRYAGMVVGRGKHVMRYFTREDDVTILALERAGKNPGQIGRSLNPPRRPNSIRGRLAIIARYQARCELAGVRCDVGEGGGNGRKISNGSAGADVRAAV